MDRLKYRRWQNVIYYIAGVIEALLGLRLIFKLLGASTGSGFVNFLYSLTRVFILPFIGIFRTVSSVGSVFEPATAVAMVIYFLIAYGIVSMLRI